MVAGRDLGDVGIAVGDHDAAQFLALLLLAVLGLAVGGELGDLRGKRGGRGLAARVRVDAGVQDEDLDVQARRHQARERLEADVVHGAVAAEDPQPPVGVARLIPAQPDAHGIGRAVLEERVGPRNGERVVRVRAGEDGVAARLGDDAHALRSVDLQRGRRDHADDRAFTAAGARTAAADEAEGVLAEHDVGQGLLVPVLDRGGGSDL